MSKQTGIIRRREIPFAQVSNHALRDKSLSLKAKGLYSLIQSYITIPNFILYKDYLMKQCKEGRDAFNSTWKELKDAGYLIQYKERGEKGVFYYAYELLDYPEPPTIEPQVENPHMDSTQVENPHLYKYYNNNTNLNNTYNKSSSSKSHKSNCKEINEEDDLKYQQLIDKCKEVGVKLSLKQLTKLMSLYDPIKVLRALEKSFNVATEKKITNGYNYIATTIENDMRQNITNVTINKEPKNKFNNYEQRQRTQEEYDEIERQLLGWD